MDSLKQLSFLPDSSPLDELYRERSALEKKVKRLAYLIEQEIARGISTARLSNEYGETAQQYKECCADITRMESGEGRVVIRNSKPPDGWTIMQRTDLPDFTWELTRPGENWTVTIPVYPGKPFCGCGQYRCEHVLVVLRAKYSPYHPMLNEAESAPADSQ